MSISSGSTDIPVIYAGAVEVQEVYSGAVLVWENAIYSEVMTVGNFIGDRWGYRSGSGGSITSYSFIGATIVTLEYDISLSQLTLSTSGGSDNLFSRLEIGGAVFQESDASYSSGGWVWTSVSNPFGTTVGATRTIKAYS